jgi:hypothetical protein
LTIPAVAITQPACTKMWSSCGGFESQRMENRLFVPPPDAANADAGGLPTDKDECLRFCTLNGGGYGTNYDRMGIGCKKEAGSGAAILGSGRPAESCAAGEDLRREVSRTAIGGDAAAPAARWDEKWLRFIGTMRNASWPKRQGRSDEATSKTCSWRSVDRSVPLGKRTTEWQWPRPS